MRIFEGVEREIAFIFHGRVAAEISNQRVRKLMQAQRKNPADQNNRKCKVILHIPSDESDAIATRWQ